MLNSRNYVRRHHDCLTINIPVKVYFLHVFQAPETGNYTFHLSGDNNCELFIRSPEQNKSEQIAIIPRWTDFNKSIS